MPEQPAMTPEFAASYRAMMLNGIFREMDITKKVFSAIPDEKSTYRHDPNGRTAWDLAWHIAQSEVGLLDGIANLKFDPPSQEQKPKNVAELVAWYETHGKRAAMRVAEMTPEQLLTPVSFAGVFNFPAVMYLGFVNNHSVHHRGALSTYLRPMGSKVPSIYGGSHDEPRQPAAKSA
jgi:uncharacterized damage-inducible protein DinB